VHSSACDRPAKIPDQKRKTGGAEEKERKKFKPKRERKKERKKSQAIGSLRLPFAVAGP